jgi:hypothetical protein
MVDLVTGLITATIMLMCWSFLFKDNPIYKISEALLIGTAVGYGVITGINSIWKSSFTQLMGGDIISIIPIILAVLMFAGYFPTARWLTRIPTTILIMVVLAVTAAGAVPGTFVEQSIATFYSLTNFNGLVLGLAVITVLFYFIFSIEHKGALGGVGRIGRIFLIAGLGGQYSFFVTTRITRWINGLTGYVMIYPNYYMLIPVLLAVVIWYFWDKGKG